MGQMLKYITIPLLMAVFFLTCHGNCDVNYKAMKIKGKLFNLEVADTQEKREAGLSGRALKENEGMLFVFEKPCRPAFWMKGVLEPLDIVWIDDEKKVVGVLERLPVCRGEDYDIYRPSSNISYAIELKGGTAKNIGLKVGDNIEL